MTREQAIKIAMDRNIKGFEGDEFIYNQIKELVNEHDINLIIETGTYYGHTTKRLADLAPVFTVEINKEYYEAANKMLMGLKDKDIKMGLGDSVEYLKRWLPSFFEKNILFFLDAHFYDYCPLLDELKSIAESGIKPVIAIHDFKVPNKNFGFDSWNGKDFDFDFIKPSLELIYGKDGFDYFYNSETSEGSANRGVIYVVPFMSVGSELGEND